MDVEGVKRELLGKRHCSIHRSSARFVGFLIIMSGEQDQNIIGIIGE
jgi:hypothetical protein